MASASPQDWSRFIVQHTPGAVITADGLGRITEFNPAAEKLLGYSREEVLGRRVEEVLHYQDTVADALPGRTPGLEERTREQVLENHSGQKVPVMVSSLTLRDGKGVPRGLALIIRDLTAVKRLEEERRHLVNMFAHDLKTPVVGVAGLIRRLLDGKVGDLAPAQRTYLTTIDREMRQLEQLLSKFLEFARLDLRILTPNPEVLAPLAICREVITLLQPLAEPKGMALKTQLPAVLAGVRADPVLFRRVLENLLENAIKYGPPHSDIVLAATNDGNQLRFSVQDHGPGIAPADLPHLFEIFYRGQGASRESGFGLGLAAVKRIIDAHGGRVWVDTGAGRGTTFYFTFPAEPTAAPEPKAPQ